MVSTPRDTEDPRIERQSPLHHLTTIGLGGRARYLFHAESYPDLIDGLDFARERGLPFFILGGGSNTIVSDRGFSGVVILNRVCGIEVIETEPDGRVLVGASSGEDWDSFVQWCVKQELVGVECLSGIPGTVGATPLQNVGAYGQEIADTLVSVDVYDTHTGGVETIQAQDCGFGYRSSRFKYADRDRYVILHAVFQLQKRGPIKIRFGELSGKLDAARAEDPPVHEGTPGTRPVLQRIRETVLQLRQSRGMVLDENDPDTRSAGSYFTNPILTLKEFALFQEKVRSHPGMADREIPTFPVTMKAHGREQEIEAIKLSAAWLMQHSGIEKGMRMNGVGVSTKHVLALVNLGGTAENLLDLEQHIRNRVHRITGITLHREPVLLGESGIVDSL